MELITNKFQCIDQIREFLTGTLQAEVKLKTTPKDKTFSVVLNYALFSQENSNI